MFVCVSSPHPPATSYLAFYPVAFDSCQGRTGTGLRNFYLYHMFVLWVWVWVWVCGTHKVIGKNEKCCDLIFFSVLLLGLCWSARPDSTASARVLVFQSHKPPSASARQQPDAPASSSPCPHEEATCGSGCPYGEAASGSSTQCEASELHILVLAVGDCLRLHQWSA